MANKTEYIKAISMSNGTNVSISRILGNTPQAVSHYREKNPDIHELINKKRMELIDNAEDVGSDLLKFHDSDNPAQAASIRLRESQYVRSRLGKNKGWAERTEIEHSGQQSISINLIEKDVKEIKDGKSNNMSKTKGNS